MHLLKNGLAALGGYVVMFAVAFVLFSLMWVVLGAEGSFRPGSWQISNAWIASSLVLGLLVSISGGFACSKLAPSHVGVVILMVLVVLVWVLSAASGVATGDPTRPAEVSMLQAMTLARQPTWLVWLNPVLGVVGVALGAKLESRAR